MNDPETLELVIANIALGVAVVAALAVIALAAVWELVARKRRCDIHSRIGTQDQADHISFLV